MTGLKRISSTSAVVLSALIVISVGCETPRMSASAQAMSDSAPKAPPPGFLLNAYGSEAHVRARLPIGTPINQARLILSDDGLSTTAQFSKGATEIQSLVASYTDTSKPGAAVRHVFNISVSDGQVAGITYSQQPPAR